MAEAREKVGVVGAGLMGAEIALVHALAGHDVLLSDRTVATTDLTRFADRDVVIEAVFENEAVKAELWKTLDKTCGPRTIFASNTSSIAISTLASYVAPARRPLFVGTHFFSPVSRMKLVEIIPAFDTAESTVEAVTCLVRGAGKTPIRVKDVTGFAVNRMLTAFFIEAVRLVEEGVATPEDLDLACRLGLGHPVGPFELMDNVSSSLALEVMEILENAYGERFHPPPLMRQMVKAGRIGRKAGLGWRTKR